MLRRLVVWHRSVSGSASVDIGNANSRLKGFEPQQTSGHLFNGRIVMNLDGIGEEQVHALLMLIILNIIVFAALIAKVQTEFALSGWCAFF